MDTRSPQKQNEVFEWEGKNSRGLSVKGEVIAASIGLAQAEVRRQGVSIIKIRKKPKPLFSPRKKKITPLDVMLFTRNLSAMFEAGLPIIQSLDILINGEDNPTMKELLEKLKRDIEGGNTIAEAMGKYPNYFDKLYCGLIHAGEQSGTLAVMLKRINLYLERSYSMKKKIKKASIYPLVIISVAVGVSFILLMFVVPKFQEMFSSFGANLPAFTQMVVNLSKFLQKYWWLLFAIIVGSIWGYSQAIRRSEAFAEFIDALILKLKIIGPLQKKIIIARFARVLATTLSAGLPVIDALQSATNVVTNRVYKKAMIQIRQEVMTGEQLNFAMNNTKLFPNLVVKMVEVGEESGSVSEMLNKIATYYEEEVDGVIDNLSSLLEPLIMVVLGVIIGGFVAAMYLPIFRLGTLF